MPRLGELRCHQVRCNKYKNGRHKSSDDQNPSPVETVGNHAAEGGEQEHEDTTDAHDQARAIRRRSLARSALAADSQT